MRHLKSTPSTWLVAVATVAAVAAHSATSQAAPAPQIGAWNSCYILLQNYDSSGNWVPDPGGPLCVEQWGTFAAACQPETACTDQWGNTLDFDCNNPFTLPGPTVTFAPGQRCSDIGYIASDDTSSTLTCAYGTFTDKNASYTSEDVASVYNCAETPPSASNVAIQYDANTSVATGTYTYSQALGAPEGFSTYQWFVNPNPYQNPMNNTQVSSAQVFDFPISLIGQYLAFCVTPVLDLPPGGGWDGSATGTSGSRVCSAWQLIASGTSAQPSLNAATNVSITFAGNVAQGNFVDPGTMVSASWWEASDGNGTNAVSRASGGGVTSIPKNYWLSASDELQYLQFRVKAQDGTVVSSPWTAVGHTLDMYEDDNLGGREVILPYEAMGNGYCFNDFRGYQFNDTMTSGNIHAPDNSQAVVTFYADSNCSGATVTEQAPQGQTTYYTMDNGLNDQVSSVRVVWNDVPYALNVKANIVNAGAGGSYAFNDPGGLLESGSAYEFRLADDTSGTNATTIATGVTVVPLTPADNGKYIQFCITPSNGYFTGVQTCSDWASVGPLAELWTDGNMSGTNVSYAFARTASGNCFNMGDYGINDMISSFTLHAKYASPTTFVFYKNGACDPSGGTIEYQVAANGTTQVGVMPSGWNDTISSMRATWDDSVTATNVTLTISGDQAAGTYTYSDNDGIPESGSTYYMQRADDASGTNTQELAWSQTWTLAAADNNKYLRFCVTPSDSVESGSQTCSPWESVGPLVELYADGNYSGANINIAYTHSAPGTCFNLTSYNFNDVVSSSQFNTPTSGQRSQPGLNQWVDVNCSGGGFSQNCLYGLTCADNDYGSYNDQISSISVDW